MLINLIPRINLPKVACIMQKKLLLIIIIELPLRSPLTTTVNLSHNMKMLNGVLQIMEKSNNSAQLKDALSTMRSATIDTQKKHPKNRMPTPNNSQKYKIITMLMIF